MTETSETTETASRSAGAPLLELVEAGKRFESQVALYPTSLAVRPGQTVALIGPSGCGKTTALRLMIGLLRPDEGSVRFRGAALGGEAEIRAMRTRLGYVVQEGGLFPHLTAGDNVCLMARHLKWQPTRVGERLQELAELVRLPSALLGRYPAEISGGQKQRVGLMRALMLDPELLLLDEPLGALDPLVRADLQDDLVEIFASLAKAVVLVTHDLAEAALFGHLIVLLREGRVVQQGSIDDLLRRPADPFVTRFIRAQRRFERPAGDVPVDIPVDIPASGPSGGIR